jgi:hypothetical protein
MARLAAAVADLTGTPEQLAVLRRDLLVPLELQALAGRAEFSTRACAISHLRNQPPLPARRTAGCAHGHDDQRLTVCSVRANQR